MILVNCHNNITTIISFTLLAVCFPSKVWRNSYNPVIVQLENKDIFATKYREFFV